MMDDMALLQEYARSGSEKAFATLVNRHIDFVYSAALRQTGNPHLAQEITQVVFIILARKAGSIRNGTILSGWLFRTARFAAQDALKTEIRRQRREQEAYQMNSTFQQWETESEWQQVSPILDQAIAQLGEPDRNAVLLRFFEKKNFRAVGMALGTNEEAAKKRVSRVVDKLRTFFVNRGTILPAATLIGVLSANSVSAAPVGLASSIVTVAVLKGTAAGASTLVMVKGTLKLMTWAKLKIAIGASTAVLLAGGVITLALPKVKVAEEVSAFKKSEEKPLTFPMRQKTKNQTSDVTPELSNSDNALSPTNIIAKVRLAYASLSSYRDTAWTVHEYNGDAWTNASTVMLGGRNCYRIEVTTAEHPYRNIDRYRSDGLDSYHQNITIVENRRLGGSTSKNSDLMGDLNSVSGETLVPTLFYSLSWGSIYTPLMFGPIAKLVRQPDENVGKVDCYVIARREAVGSSNEVHQVTLWVGKEDFLVRRWRDFNLPTQPDAKPRIRTETHENIVVNEEFNRGDYVQPFPTP